MHIGYRCDGLKYVTNKRGAWVTETVDSAGYVGTDSSLALDGEGNVHISYFDDYPNADLKYATNKSGVWVMETVDSYGWVGYDSSLALDSEGKAYISYFDSASDDLKYATNKSGAWVTETVDSCWRCRKIYLPCPGRRGEGPHQLL